MPEQSIAVLLKTHKIERGTAKDTKEDYYTIHVNKPEDFIYDTSDIIIQYTPSTGVKEIRCPEIPDNIKEKMTKFSFLEISKFVEFIEDNLITFMMGKSPALEQTFNEQQDENASFGELPSNFKFPIHNNVTSNLRCDLSKTNILIVCCLQLNLVVRCNQCHEISNLVASMACKKCSHQLGFVYVPIVYNDFLGFLQMKGCEIVSFNPMKYQFSCEACSKNYESTDIGVGQIYTRKCSGCYKEVRLKINKLDLYKKNDVKVKEGTELPEKGTCKHYQKSFRWFRFPCCNSLYPCDVCHDEKAGHKSEQALRMVCGLCSKEQSVKPECNCGMKLKKKASQFWEGGKGNRNKVAMNKNCKKKYS